MSKASPLVNGENNCGGGDFGNANVNMVAIMDSRSNKTQDFPSNQDKCAKMYSCDFDHMYASVNDVSCAGNQVKDKETKHLKELLLLHLDLIQQQSEQIVTKDKQIASLKQDYETLKMRFDRMERRVTLKRHRGSTAEQLINNSSQSSCSNAVVVQSEGEVKSSLGPESKEEGEQLKDSTEGSLVRRRICKRISQESDSGKKRRVSTGSGGFGRKKRTISLSSDKTKQCSDVYYGETDKKVKERLKLRTDSAYYTVVGEFDSCWSTCDTGDVSTEEQVQVPTWREKPIAPCYVMEGTENLGDDVFSKRHQRLEIDERRRKRWDIQRIREQNHVDKLKQKLNKHQNPQSSEHPLSSFFPSIDDLEEISIEDQLPVLAFGLEIPLFENRYSVVMSTEDGSIFMLWVSSVCHGAFTCKKSRSLQPARGGCRGRMFCPRCERVRCFPKEFTLTESSEVDSGILSRGLQLSLSSSPEDVAERVREEAVS